MSLHFAKESESIRTGFGPELDTQLKELVTRFVDVHRVGTFDHKIRPAAYLKRQRRNHLFAFEYEKLKRQCIDLFK